MLNDLKSLLLTLTACVVTGWWVSLFGLPAPYLLGALLGSWLFSKVRPGFLPEPGIPRWFHKAVVLGLSVLIGAAFTPAVLVQLGLWLGTVLTMLVTTLVATLAGYSYLYRMRAYSPPMALLCALPGGQAEVIAISRDLVEKDYVVAFCHLVRVAVVVCLIPLLLALSEGSEGVAASYVAVRQLPSVFTLSSVLLFQFVGIAAAGYALASLLRVPIPHLLGPLLLSSLLHMLGWVEIPRINEFVLLAQVTIGGAVGAKLGRIKTSELAGYLLDALCLSVILVSVYSVVAIVVAYWGGHSVMEMMLAFIPGGIYEVTVLAVIFGFDVAFVAFHHTVRVLVIFLGLPLLVKTLQ